MLGNDLFTARFEQTRNLWPGIVGFDKRAAGVAERTTPGLIAKQPDHRVGKIVGRIGGKEMTSRFKREPFRADAGRHDGLRHRERLENLDACTAARAQRHHIDGPLRDRRPHVVERSRDHDSRSRPKFTDPLARIASNDRE